MNARDSDLCMIGEDLERHRIYAARRAVGAELRTRQKGYPLRALKGFCKCFIFGGVRGKREVEIVENVPHAGRGKPVHEHGLGSAGPVPVSILSECIIIDPDDDDLSAPPMPMEAVAAHAHPVS